MRTQLKPPVDDSRVQKVRNSRSKKLNRMQFLEFDFIVWKNADFLCIQDFTPDMTFEDVVRLQARSFLVQQQIKIG